MPSVVKIIKVVTMLLEVFQPMHSPLFFYVLGGVELQGLANCHRVVSLLNGQSWFDYCLSTSGTRKLLNVGVAIAYIS